MDRTIRKRVRWKEVYFHRTQTGCTMAEYTNTEKADMILAYGATDCNGRAAQRLYTERHPVRRTPAHTMFARLHQKLCETGSFQTFHAEIVVVKIGGVTIYRTFGEFRRAKSYCHLYGAQGQQQAYFLPLATMNFVRLDLTTSDRWH
ncbi:DUF4817 domain-containing protein [Trichonephila clavipes]|nr:DUF4817 domain-containing protein [Trichonephila clavipes]